LSFSTDSPNKTIITPSSVNSSKEATSFPSLETSNPSVDNKPPTKPVEPERNIGLGGQKRPRSEGITQPIHTTFDSTMSSSSQPVNPEKKLTQGGRCRLFIGNVPSDLTQDEFQLLFGKYGELVEYFVNPSRGFGFIKLVYFIFEF
jgi:hypothetical protein